MERNEKLTEEQQTIANLVRQLASLYREKEQLHRALGVSDGPSIIHMVRSLEQQLCTLYEDKAASVESDRNDLQ